jgi:hypothetical protein
MTGCPPIPDRRDFQQVILTAQTFQAVVDHLPDARNISMDFTLSVLGPAAWPVHKAFGTSSYRAKPAR